MKITKKKIILAVIIVVVAGSFSYFKFFRKPVVEYSTAVAEKGKLVQTVSETGTVKAPSELNLNFLNAGKVAKINVSIGDKVATGQILAELDYSALSIKEKQAEANLAKLLAGATAQDIAIAEATARQAETSYSSALNDLDKTKKSAAEAVAQASKRLSDLTNHTASDITNEEQAVTTAEINLANVTKTYQQSLNNKIDVALSTGDDKLAAANIALDNVNKVLTDNDIQNLLSVKNSAYLTDTNNNYASAKTLIDSAYAYQAIAKQARISTNADAAVNAVLAALGKTSDTLTSCYRALENTIVSSNFTQTDLDAFKSSISGQQTVISAAISTAQTAKQSLSDAELAYNTNVATASNNLDQARVSLDNALTAAQNAFNTATLTTDQQIAAAQSRVDAAKQAWDVAKSQLNKIKAPARKEDITLAQADLDSVRKQIENSIIRAPIDGFITKSNYEVGEDVSGPTPAISMLGENSLEIEILVSEADITKVQKDDAVEITFDAFPSDVVFKGIAYFIEPAETVVSDVVYYKVKVKMTDQKEVEDKAGDGIKVKSGMTANTVIMTAQKDNVIMIPARAVVEKAGGAQIVRILINNAVKEVPVTIGLRGDEGMVEVASGDIKEGDVVVTSIKSQ